MDFSSMPKNIKGWHCDMLIFLCITAVLLLTGFLISELLFHYTNPLLSYGYSYRNGPRNWIQHFPESSGERQSPVNIISALAVRVVTSTPESCERLTWHCYEALPTEYTLFNDGRKVAMIGKWATPQIVPALSGSFLKMQRYRFIGLHFRWGPNDEWGAEHTLNYKSFPLEMQLLHIRADFSSLEKAIASGEGDGVLMLSYFFKIVPRDNQYLCNLALNLGRLRLPGARIALQPFPLFWLAPPFQSKFYAYIGSMSEPPCSQVVTWILKFSPKLTISSRQLAEFRRLLSADGPIMSNSRPVQHLNGRKIVFYDYGGKQ